MEKSAIKLFAKNAIKLMQENKHSITKPLKLKALKVYMNHCKNKYWVKVFLIIDVINVRKM